MRFWNFTGLKFSTTLYDCKQKAQISNGSRHSNASITLSIYTMVKGSINIHWAHFATRNMRKRHNMYSYMNFIDKLANH